MLMCVAKNIMVEERISISSALMALPPGQIIGSRIVFVLSLFKLTVIHL